MNRPIVSGSGIRGVFGSSIGVGDALAYSACFGELVGPGPVVVGRDTRSSGPAVEAAVVAGLCSVGCSPVLVGIAPTPTIQLETARTDAVGGIAVTSSHNPGDWNALKLIGGDGVFLRSGPRARLISMLEEPRRASDYRSVGRPRRRSGAIRRHVEGLLGLPWVRPARRRLRAVLDVTGGTGRLLGPAVMEALGVEYSVIMKRMLPDGGFPRIAEPVQENLGALCEAVRERRADVGFAFDPDGDRLALVDERGRAAGEEYTVALALQHLLPSRPGPVVVNLSTSSLAGVVASRQGRSLFRSPVGEVNVVEEMEARGALCGGEGNGGVIDRLFHPGRDSAVGMAAIVALLDGGATLGGMVEALPAFCMVKTKFELAAPFRRLAGALEDEFGPADDRRDGLWFARGGCWMHIRPSGTEPVCRFIAEGPDRDGLQPLIDRFERTVKRICAE